MRVSDILLKPVVTEKSLKLQEIGGYTFLVNPKAGKNQIKKAVAELFGVKVVSIKTSIKKGENKRNFRLNKTFKKAKTKKAIVMLAKDQKIDLMVLEKKDKK